MPNKYWATVTEVTSEPFLNSLSLMCIACLEPQSSSILSYTLPLITSGEKTTCHLLMNLSERIEEFEISSRVFDHINPEKKIDAPAYAVVTGACVFVAATTHEDRCILSRGDQKLLGCLRYLSPTSSVIIINHILYSSDHQSSSLIMNYN